VASQPEQPQPQEVVPGWRQQRQSRRPMKTTARATAMKTRRCCICLFLQGI